MKNKQNRYGSVFCLRLVKFQLKIPLPQPNQCISINSSKPARIVKGLVSILLKKGLYKNEIVLPNIINYDKDMVHCFNNFFCQNILIIGNGFPSSTLSLGASLLEESCIYMMDTFQLSTYSDML